MARILVVDDDRRVLEVIRRVLQRLGHEVATAGSGQEALQGPAPDLLVTDISMPGMDGVELAQRLRERSPGLKVAFVTGGGAPELLERAASIGPVVAKELAIDVLAKTVEQMLASSPLCEVEEG